jgi:hypothetical protein
MSILSNVYKDTVDAALGEVLDRIEAAQVIGEAEDAHSFLRAVYRNPALPLGHEDASRRASVAV